MKHDFVPCLHEHKAMFHGLANAARVNNSVACSGVVGYVTTIMKKPKLRHQQLYTFDFFHATFRCIAK